MVVGDQNPHSRRLTVFRCAFCSHGYVSAPEGLAGNSEVDRGACCRPRLDRQLAADQQRPLAHAGDAEAALGLVEGEAAAVVGDVELDAAVLATAQRRPRPGRRRCAAWRWRAPPGRPGRRPAARRRRGRRSRPRPRTSASISPRPICSTWPAIAAARPRSSSAVGRSWRASESSSRIAWLASALVSASSASSSGGAASRAASRRSSRPVSDWLTSSCRSRATRARSSSCAAQRGAARPPPLGLEPLASSAGRRARSAPPPRSRRRRRSSAGRTGPGRLRSTFSISSISRSSGARRRRASSPGWRRGRATAATSRAITATVDLGPDRSRSAKPRWCAGPRYGGWHLWSARPARGHTLPCNHSTKELTA